MGVQSAAETYFSKCRRLTLAESAVLCCNGSKSSRYGLCQTIKPEDYDNQTY